MLSAALDILKRRELLLTLAGRNLKLRYKGSVLGFLWTLLDPLILMLIYYFVFSLLIAKFPVPNFALLLITGLLGWTFLSMTVSDSLGSVLDQAHLVKKIYFPREILPLAVLLANLANFILALGVLVAIFAVLGFFPGWTLLLVPVVIAVQAMFILGLGMLVATANVFFRDIEHIIQALLLAWFFLTPIVYPVEVAANFLGTKEFLGINLYGIYLANPMAMISLQYQHLLVAGEVYQPLMFLCTAVQAAAVFWIGWRVFHRAQRHFADLI